MQVLEAASRIVEIQEVLTSNYDLGPQKREELMHEKDELWDREFLGRPYEDIARNAWMHKVLFRY